MKRLILMVLLAVAVQLTAGQNLFADGSDVTLDFVAAAPFTYNHQTGGGAYNVGSVGVEKDIVNSLEGGDFKCGDIVTFFVLIRMNSETNSTVTMNWTFTSYTTGQQGAAYVDVVQVTTNCNGQLVENGEGGCGPGPLPSPTPPCNCSCGGKGFFGLDGGCFTSGPISASIDSKILPAQFFIKPSFPPRSINVTATASGLSSGDTAVVRIDARLGCNGQVPSGDLLATINWATVGSLGIPINIGTHTIPLKIRGLELP